MMRGLRAFPGLLRVGFVSALAYRAEFLVWMLAYTMPLIMLALWTAVAAEGPLGRFGEKQFSAYFIGTLLVRLSSGAWVAWDLNFEVRQGTLQRRLLWPVHALLTFLAENLAALPMRALMSVPIAIATTVWLGNVWVSDPVQIAIIPLTLLGAFLLTFLPMAMIGTLSLFWESSLSMWDLWLALYTVLSGYVVPLELFPPQLSAFVNVLPFRFMLAVPVENMIGLMLVQLRAAILLQLQYRLDFFLDIVLSLFWIGAALAPLYVLFSMRDAVNGWNAYEMLVVVGFFSMHKGVLASVIQPSLNQAVEHIRKGTLDFLLLKPADAQFMLSTSKLELAHLTDTLAGVLMIVWALAHLPASAAGLGASDLAFAVVLFLCGLAILYAIWIMVISLAFRVVKVDNLSYLFSSLFEAARWPSSIFRGILSLFFTFIIPLALMTTYPALAILGRAQPKHFVTAAAVACALLALSRYTWNRSIRAYTGASS